MDAILRSHRARHDESVAEAQHHLGRGASRPIVRATVDVSTQIIECSRWRAITDPQEKTLSASRGETGAYLAYTSIG